MECLSIVADKLIADARAAGLEVLAAGPRLVVRGPRAAEAIAQELLADKPAVMTTLATEGDWDCWTEVRDGVTWHIMQRVDVDVSNWCDWPPVPRGICSAEVSQ